MTRIEITCITRHDARKRPKQEKNKHPTAKGWSSLSLNLESFCHTWWLPLVLTEELESSWRWWHGSLTGESLRRKASWSQQREWCKEAVALKGHRLHPCGSHQAQASWASMTSRQKPTPRGWWESRVSTCLSDSSCCCEETAWQRTIWGGKSLFQKTVP